MANKLVSLRLVSLYYGGESIGDDLTIEVRAADRMASVGKKLSAGQSVLLNRVIGRWVVTEAAFSIPLILRVVERDPVFDDVGELTTSLSVNLAQQGPQHFTYNIQVQENLGVRSEKAAVFAVEIEAAVSAATQYVADVGEGWVTEGIYRGRKASISLRKDGTSYLEGGNPHQGAARIVYSISDRVLSFKGASYQATDDPANPLTKGRYDLEIPDAPHKGGLNYPDVVHARTWFRIGHGGDRFLHTGRASLGCITLIERNRWDTLYADLIRSRKGDCVSVGILEVVA